VPQPGEPDDVGVPCGHRETGTGHRADHDRHRLLHRPGLVVLVGQPPPHLEQ